MYSRLCVHDCSISDVQASELPDDVRAELKSYAQEVASCLVNELGFDPSQCIYALGKTADLIGHSVRVSKATVIYLLLLVDPCSLFPLLFLSTPSNEQ